MRHLSAPLSPKSTPHRSAQDRSNDLSTHCLGDVATLQDFILRHPRLFVVSGAGISHASGIPTYRDEEGNWKSNRPIQHGEFMRSEAVRKRYWVRSFVGWPNVASATPNLAHEALTELEALGYVQTLVTQNIDRLHQRSGHRQVVDLHGRLDQVVCMQCRAVSPRAELQLWLAQHNSQLQEQDFSSVMLAPDGDAEVAARLVNGVRLPDCPHCGGILKPNVVFYGDSVVKQKIDYLMERLDQADALLTVGTSLMVYSSFRFCKNAASKDIPMACINQGLTRADPLFQLKVAADCGQTLHTLAQSLPARS